jgi:hypothetical protein
MPIVIPPGFAQINVNFSAGGTGRACTSVFGIAMTDTLTQAEWDAFSTGLGSQYKLIIKSPGRYEGMRILVGQDGPDPIEFNSVSGAGAGGTALESVPPQVMWMAKKTTALAGRRHRGRTYFPDLQETSCDKDGTIISGTLTALQTLCDGISSVFSSGTKLDGMVLLHDVVDPPPTPVTSYLASGKVATLRPRYER